MTTKKRYPKFVVFVFCAAMVLASGSCQTSRNQAHKSTPYQKERTRYQPRWNATTSQSTTYYISKNSARKGHDSKRIRR